MSSRVTIPHQDPCAPAYRLLETITGPERNCPLSCQGSQDQAVLPALWSTTARKTEHGALWQVDQAAETTRPQLFASAATGICRESARSALPSAVDRGHDPSGTYPRSSDTTGSESLICCPAYLEAVVHPSSPAEQLSTAQCGIFRRESQRERARHDRENCVPASALNVPFFQFRPTVYVEARGHGPVVRRIACGRRVGYAGATAT